MFLCFGIMYCVYPAGVAFSAVESEEGPFSDYPMESGRLTYIGRETLTIEDQGYSLTEATRYLTKEGNLTSKGYFHVGDEVKYIYDPVGLLILEMRSVHRGKLKNAPSSSTTEHYQNKGIKFQDGVWTN